MNLELFCACDYASAEVSGKLTIIGAFDTIFTKSIPATHGLMCLAAKVRFNLDELGLKKVRVSFLSPENLMVMPPMETQVPVNAGQGDPTATAQIAITIVALRLPILGEYRFDLEVENTPLASIPLFVRKVDANPDQQQP